MAMRRMTEDERWDLRATGLRCGCGDAPEFRDDTTGSVACVRHADATSRISLALPVSLVARLDAQVASTGLARAYLIEAAITGVINEFEAIDADPIPPSVI